MSMDNPVGDPVSAIVKKLTPRLLAVILIVLLAALTLVVTFAMYRGGSVNLIEMTFSAPSDQYPQIEMLEANVRTCKENLTDATERANKLNSRPTNEALKQCEDGLAMAIPVVDLASLVDTENARNDVLERIEDLSRTEKSYDLLNRNYYFKLFLLETRIPQFGSAISTHIDDADRHETYELLQEILLELGFFEGQIDGAQQATNSAVKKFQNTYNDRLLQNVNPSDPATAVEALRPLGHVGYRTLEAFRSWYRENEA